MIRLHGFALSNYTNMCKFALLEKNLNFEEVAVMPSQDPEHKKMSPMGKLPVLETEKGFISETAAIIDYLETVYPTPSLFPSEPFAAGKVREMVKILELYIELQGRRHYPELFFGGERDQSAYKEVRPVIENALGAIKRLASFSPYLMGDFTMADIVAYQSFCYTAPVCQAIYDWDIVAEVPGLGDAINATKSRNAGVIVDAAHQAGLKAMQEGS